MRTLSATLLAAQKSLDYQPLYKVAITGGSTYDNTRIIDIEDEEWPTSRKVTIILDNSDNTFTDAALEGSEVVVSYGAITTAGSEYSATSPVYISHMETQSMEDRMVAVLTCVGIPDLLGEDEASEVYQPVAGNTDTAKTVIIAVLAATMTAFSHCKAFTPTWDSEDALVDVYKPADTLRVYPGNSRQAVLNRMLGHTAVAMLVKVDGAVHMFVPTTSGVVYDYEYALADGSHTFNFESNRTAIPIPNWIQVATPSDAAVPYSGVAYDASWVSGNIIKDKRHYEVSALTSNQQGADIAAAMLSKVQMGAQTGSAVVPMNFGQELYDYVKVTDSRQSNFKVGNIGYLKRRVKYDLRKDELTDFSTTFQFGGWLSIRNTVQNLQNTLDYIGPSYQYFSRLATGNLYAEDIIAENIDFNNFDLDDLPDGAAYARVNSLHLDAGQIKIDSAIQYAANYNPTEKFDLNNNDLDDVPNGVTFHRVASAALTAAGLVILDQVYFDTVGGTYGLVLNTDLSAGHLKLTSSAVISGEWYDESGVSIDASAGIIIYGSATAFRIRATKTGADQVYADSTGALLAAAGKFKIDANGVYIYDDALWFGDAAQADSGAIFGSASFTYSNVFVLFGYKNIYIKPSSSSYATYMDYLNFTKGSDVSGSRAINTNYQNNTAKYMLVTVIAVPTATVYSFGIHFQSTSALLTSTPLYQSHIAHNAGAIGDTHCLHAIIPPGYWYKVAGLNIGTAYQWIEHYIG